jgi:signal transduction histidine kinase
MSSRQSYPILFFLTLFLVLLSVLVVVAGTVGAVHAARRVIATTAEYKLGAIRDLVTNTNLPISNLYYSKSKQVGLSPLQVKADETLLVEEGAGKNAPLPEQCLMQYAESAVLPAAEICAAFSGEARHRRLLLAIDYCSGQPAVLHEMGSAPPTRGSFLQLALSSGSDSSLNRAWIAVFQKHKNGKLTEVTGYSVDPLNWQPRVAGKWSSDGDLHGELWSPVTRSNRCPNQRGRKERARISVDLGSETAGKSDEQYVSWMRDLEVRVAVSDRPRDVSEVLDFKPYDSGVARYRPWSLTESILAPGETVFVGLSENGQCSSRDMQERAQNSGSVPATASQPNRLFRLIASQLVRLGWFRELESFCVVAPSGVQPEFVVYTRSTLMNATIVATFLSAAWPWVGALSLFILVCAAILYWVFGRRLRRLVDQLRKARGSSGHVDGSIFSEEFLKEFVSERTEIGTTALAFRELLTGLRQQDENRRKLDEIISHEIRTPVHNLRRSLPESPDVRRMLTALEVLDQVNDSAEELRSAPAATVKPVAELVTELCDALQEEYGPIDCEYATGDEKAVYVPDLLGLTISNLIKNAGRFRVPGTPIKVFTCTENDRTFIRLHNTGSEISPQDHDKIFELGYTKAGPQQEVPRKGPNRGIGLFISRFYMQLMRGNLRVLDCADGALFEIELPAGG